MVPGFSAWPPVRIATSTAAEDEEPSLRAFFLGGMLGAGAGDGPSEWAALTTAVIFARRYADPKSTGHCLYTQGATR